MIPEAWDADMAEAIVLRLLARLAALWLVLQTFVVKEDLFASGPNEVLATINTSDRSILKVSRLTVPGFS
ncbi:MAG TPA: hypothetical protein VHD88_01355 [Pyrinomonadaceae bacterium]|nr:hypothetical protein [Pyrinomonadaceae bacterium]